MLVSIISGLPVKVEISIFITGFPTRVLTLNIFIIEAEMAKQRVIELKNQDFNRRKEELIYTQAKEREEVEQAHILEYQEFNKNWDDVMHKTAEENQIAIKALEEKHIHELEENRQKLE